MAISDKVKSTRKEIDNALSVMQLDELKNRKRVLRRLKFTDEGDVIQLKARVACEISTGDEVVLTELLFDNFFLELSPEQCAACLSCFIFEEKSNDTPALKEELARPYRKIKEKAKFVAGVSRECKLALDEEEYLNTFKFELMEVVYAWTKGASFAAIWYVTNQVIIYFFLIREQQNDRCVRGQPHSTFPKIGGAASTGWPSSQSDGQRRA